MSESTALAVTEEDAGGAQGVPLFGVRSSRGWSQLYGATNAALDGLAMGAGALAAVLVRFGTLDQQVATANLSYLLLVALMVPAWVATMALTGVYEQRYIGAGSEEHRRVFVAAARLLAIIAVGALLLKVDLARVFVAMAVPLATVLALGHRYVSRRWLRRQRAQGRFHKRVVIVGTTSTASQLVRELRASPAAGFVVLGACVPSVGSRLVVDGHAVPILGGPEEAADRALRCGADVIAVADGRTLDNDSLRSLAWQLEGRQIELLLAPNEADVAGPRVAVRPVTGLPLLHVEEPELSGARRLVKEVFDRCVAFLLLLLLAPLLLLVVLLVRLTSTGPALFKQPRVGIDGRTFLLWKFRSMRVGAEDCLADLSAQNDQDGPLFKMRCDPRVTRLGRILRRLSIDELPQLWNVLRGDMSLVGPRPPLPTEVAQYCHRVRRRLLVKPGMTGLWQVSGRANLGWEESVRLDLFYVENWSPSLDATILAKTISTVFSRRGAF